MEDCEKVAGGLHSSEIEEGIEAGALRSADSGVFSSFFSGSMS